MRKAGPFILLIISICFSLKSQAQDPGDSTITHLNEVVIYGFQPLQFLAGNRTQSIESSKRRQSPLAPISKLIQQGSSLYIKEYGNQMLSTISIRGTGAGHTSTLWNGLNINSPTLGQFDYSQAPSMTVDEVLLQTGGTSALFGNESIGGTIMLLSSAQWNDTPSFFVHQDFGSFGLFNTGVGFRTNTDAIETSSRIYFSRIRNDFPFVNVLKPGSPIENQQNAGSVQRGAIQDLYWRPKPGRELSVHAWLHQSDRELQPPMTDQNGSETQEDRNIRVMARWNQSGDLGSYQLSFGFLRDHMLYNQSIKTNSDQVILRTNIRKGIGKKLDLNLGGSVNLLGVTSDNFQDRITEGRWDIYGWLRYMPWSSLTFVANLRLMGADRITPVLSPSIGSELILSNSRTTLLKWNIQASRNYRIPTINDRYWSPGGNPDLDPEEGYSVDTGLDLNYNLPSFSNHSRITVYRMWIDNWILWLPNGAFWSPLNLRKVVGSGFEFISSGSVDAGNLENTYSLSYTYTKSTNMSTLDEYDRSLDKQLPYVPFHKISLFIGSAWATWEAGLSATYTGKRFITTDNEDHLNGFWLMDLQLGKKFGPVQTILRAENLFNITYYHLPLRPLPGRSYQVSMTLSI